MLVKPEKRQRLTGERYREDEQQRVRLMQRVSFEFTVRGDDGSVLSQAQRNLRMQTPVQRHAAREDADVTEVEREGGFPHANC